MSIHLRLLAIALGSALALQPALSEEIRDYYAEPGINPFKETLDQNFNESVDPFSGTLQLKYTDVHIPGNGGMDVNVTRTYTSLQTNAYPITNRNGLGWTMHFGRIVSSRSHLNKICAQATYPLTTKENPSLELPDGGRELLVLSSLHNDGTLITRSNWIARCTGAQGMVVTAPDGTRYTMDRFDNFQDEPSFMTTRIEDVHGNWIAIDYATNAVGINYIQQIRRSEDGVVATFEYEDQDSPGIAVCAIVAGRQRWVYEYEAIAGFTFPHYKQLVRVIRPDGRRWVYTYNPKLSDPDPNDGVLEDGIASYSLTRVIYPHGATIDYTYQFVQFDPGSMEKTTSIQTKIVSGSQVQGGTWTYQFAPHSSPYNDSHGGQLRHDVTIVAAPEATYRYVHMGKDYRPGEIGQTIFIRPSFVGLLVLKETFGRGSAGALIEREANSWGERRISEEDFWHGAGYRSWWRDNGTYAPVLQGKYVSRDSQIRDSIYAHAQLFSDFDQYGNPRRIFANSNIVGQPAYQKRITYLNDTTKWIIGLPDDEIHEQVLDSNETSVATIEREYDEFGNLLGIVEFGQETRYSYHASGDVHTVRDARGNTTRYSSYKRGIARMEERPESVVIRREVDDSGTLGSKTDGRGFTTRYDYDALNRLTGIDYPIKADVSISYSSIGGAQLRVLTRGNYRQSETINDFGQTVRVERHDVATGQTIYRTARFDALGREVFTSYPNATIGNTVAYDALGRIEQITHPDNAVVRYQHEDASVTVTNERGFSTEYLYLVLGTGYEDSMPVWIAEPENVGTLITRNVFGDVTRVFQGERFADDSVRGYGKTYRYDAARRLVESYEREVGNTFYGHDEVGNVVSERVNNLSATTFVYDNLNRRTRVDFPDTTPDVVTEYDDNDNVTRVTKGVTEWFYVHDENDNLESERLTINDFLLGPRVYQFVNGYSELDVLASTVYPSGLAVDYAPDAFGRATRAGSFASDITYHPSGQVASYRLANGITTNIALNQRLLPLSITAPGVVSLTYGYDVGGNVLSIVDGIDSTKNVSIPGSTQGYDQLDRLRQANGSWGIAAFSYDFNGNIIEKNVGSRGMKFTFDEGRRLRHIDQFPSGLPNNPNGSLRFDFDARGNAIARRARNTTDATQPIDEKLFGYDAASQLVRARVNSIGPDGTTVVVHKNYAYDGNGQRAIERKHASYDVRFSVYVKGQLLFEDDVARCTRTEHIRLGALAMARSDDQSAPPSLDSDGDQIPDCIETQLGLNPADAADGARDTDGDGLTSLQEYRAGTSPTRADTDNDGLSDREEVERDLTDPTLADTDGDGLSDADEAAHPGLDPRSADSDHDGVSDNWEVRLQTDPANPADGLLDSDSDGFSNRQESAATADPQLADLAPARGTGLWSATMHGETYGAPVIGRDRAIYIKTSGGRVQAFYPDGTRRWEFVPLSSSVSDPAVGPDGTIYVATIFNGGIEQGAPRSFLYALNPDGSQQWVWGTPYYLDSPVTIGQDGRLYFAGYDARTSWRELVMSLGRLGTEPATRVIQSGASAPLAVDLNGNVIMPSGDRIQVFSKTLEPRWTYTLRSYSDVAPSVAKDGTIFVGDRSGYVYALTSAGQLRWERATGNSLASSVVIGSDGTLYVGTHQGALLALNAADGTERWSLPTTGTTFTPAVSESGAVYVTTYAGDLIAASASGAQLWKHTTGSRVYSAPVMDRDGTLYFAAVAGVLHAVADNGGGPARSAWPMYRHDSASTSYICFNEPAFSILADTDGDRIEDCAELRYGLDPYNPNDGTADNDGDGLRNYEEHQLGTRLDLADTDGDGLNDGLEVLTYRTSPLDRDTDHDAISDGDEIRMSTNPLDAIDATADVDNDGFSNRQEAFANTNPLDPSSRPTEAQLVRTPSSGGRVAVATDGTMYQVNGSDGSLEALYPDLTLKWRATVSILGGPVVGADGSVYVVEKRNYDSQRVLAYWPNGLLRWAFSKPASAYTGFSEHIAIGSDGRVFVSYSNNDWNGDYVFALGMDGTLVADWPQHGVRYFGRAGTLSIGPNGELAVYDGYNSLTLFSSTGERRWESRTQEIGRGGAGNAVFGADGTLYLSNSYGLHAVDPANGTPRWRKIGASGSPIIDANGHIVLFCAYNQSLCAVDANNNTVWTESTGYAFRETPVISSSGPLVNTETSLVSFDSTGAVRWQVALAQGSRPVYSPVVLDDGTVYVPGYPQGVVVLGRGGLANSTWPARHRDNRGTRNAAPVQSIAPSPAPSVMLIDPLVSPISIDIGQNRTVRAMATDLEDGDVSAAIRWSSSIDGEFATGTMASLRNLSVGTHTITASVLDSDGLSGNKSFELVKGAIPPVLTISSPSSSQTFDVGQRISFWAYATDPVDGTISHRIRWSSDREGELHVGNTFERSNLSPGVHVITATVADSSGASDSKSISITIEHQAPSITLAHPSDMAEVELGRPVTFNGWAQDPADGNVGASLRWTSDRDGLLGTGATFTVANLSAGTHSLTVTAQDSVGNVATSRTSFVVRVLPPTVYVGYPEAGLTTEVGNNILFYGSASDSKDGDLGPALQWSSSLDGHIGTGNQYFIRNDLSVGAHLITASVTDSDGATAVNERYTYITSPNNYAPSLYIEQPSDGSEHYATDPVTLRASASDSEDGQITAITWTSSRDGALGVGTSITTTSLSVGTHRITAFVRDSANGKAARMIIVNVVPMPANFPPQVRFESLPRGASYTAGSSFSLTGFATDREDGAISQRLQWSSDINGPLGAGATVLISGLSAGLHTITASATDSYGATASNSFQLEIAATGTSRFMFDNFGSGSIDDVDWVAVDDEITTASNWSVVNGRAMESSDAQAGDAAAAALPKPGTYLLHTAGTNWLDYRLEAVLRSSDDDALGLMLRYVDNDNYYRFSMDRERSYRRLVRKVNGVFTTLWQDATRYSLNTNVSVAITAVGSTLSLSINGTQVYSGTDTSHRRGSIALYSWGQTGSMFDDVRVVNLRTSASNDAPLVSINSPANNSNVLVGSVVSLSGTALDFEDGTMSHLIDWSSSRDGALGTGATLNVSSLSVGAHTLTARATDSRAATGSASVTLNVNEPFNEPPALNVTAPTQGATFNIGTAVPFAGTATDAEDGTISNGIAWISSRDGTLGTGESFNVSSLSAGAHAITARITDSGGKSTTVTRNIAVAVPGNNSPTITLSAPLNGSAHGVGRPVTLSATANDVEDGNLTSVIAWASSRDGALGAGGSLNVSTLSGGEHTITATVNDSMGGTRSASVAITVVPTSAQLLLDDFEDQNYTGWTVTNQGTISAPSVWSAASRALRQTSDIHSTPTTAATVPKPGTFNRWTAGSAWTNYSATVQLRSSDNDTLGVMFRYTSTSNYYRFSMDAERSNRRLAKVRNGTWTTLWQDTGAYQLNRTYVLEIIANGSTITVKLDGVQLWSGTDANALTGGTIAMYSWQNTEAEFDNVLVRNLAVPLSNLNRLTPGRERLRMEAPVLASVRERRPEPPPVPREPPDRFALVAALLSTHRPIGEGAVR